MTQSLIGITGQWSSTVPVDKRGDALGNAVIWCDMRGARCIGEMMGGLINLGGYAVDQLVRWLRVVGAPPGMAGTEPIGHALYLRDNVFYPEDALARGPKPANAYDLLNRVAAETRVGGGAGVHPV